MDISRGLSSFRLKTRKYLGTSDEKMLVLYACFYYNKKRSVKMLTRRVKISLRNLSAPGGYRAAGAVNTTQRHKIPIVCEGDKRMEKKKKTRFLVGWLLITAALLAGSLLVPGHGKSESVQEAMRDAVLHGTNRISLFGLKDVNPAYISSLVVVGVILLTALLLRLLVIPRFKLVPGKLQMAIETVVGMFDGMAKGNSPHRNKFLGAYIFGAGVYIFIGTLFELFGFQAITTNGHTIALPAPLSDVNAAISLGCLSYGVILVGGIVANGLKGAGKALKDFSLPISMSFRMFGALLSGLLVTELVYYYVTLSYVIPVIVAVLFTLLHALIQAYVLTTLTSMFYGETTEKHAPKPRKAKKVKAETVNN